uniref:Uncharacterized protein n=1 Tax=Podoviridae sp. ct8Lf7 TaxID=2827723 RepID=A0A8S5S0I4_9CAUD|nr:MAG TPA: hypothetical protein [Podoviridae sp. ct8Lf7]
MLGQRLFQFIFLGENQLLVLEVPYLVYYLMITISCLLQ